MRSACWDRAACGRTRKGQAVIALSSCESECYGLVSAASHALGDVATAADWGVLLQAHILMDASAAIALGSRRGLGKVRHVDTAFLWVQSMVASGRIVISKRPGQDMLADVLTKGVAEKRMLEMMSRMGYAPRAGYHQLALQAA